VDPSQEGGGPPGHEGASEWSRVASAFRSGDPRALARSISMVEREDPRLEALMALLPSASPPPTRRIGITGSPGVGKSSLVADLARRIRGSGASVGVLAVDPSSAGSGGALLGDRIRMGAIGQDPGVFIRSMGARGAHGGIAAGTTVVLELMERFGLGEILVETVGVGQTEIGVDALVDTVVLVLVPESGDAVQAMKAGLTEIADVFVVNKADRPGAEALASVLQSAVEEARLAAGEADAPEARRWTPPVLLTSADRGAGVDPLLDALERHHRHLLETGELEAHRRTRTTLRLRQAVDAALRRRVAHAAGVDGWEGRVVDRILEGRTSVNEAVAAFLERLFPPSGPGSGSDSTSPGAAL